MAHGEDEACSSYALDVRTVQVDPSYITITFASPSEDAGNATD